MRHCQAVIVGAAGTWYAAVSGAAQQSRPVRIAIEPDSVVVAPGATVQFTAGAWHTDGRRYRAIIEYSATGGAILPSGQFTASDAEGRYLVIARHAALPLADTAIVIVNRSAPPPKATPEPVAPPPAPTERKPVPSPPRPRPTTRDGQEWHEPAGLEPLTDRGFCTLATNLDDRRNSEGWDPVESRYRPFTVSEDDQAPLSPPCVLATLYRADHRSGTAPGTAQIQIRRPRQRHLYHRFAIKLDGRFVGNQSTTNKLFHLWIGGGNRLFYRAVGSGNNPLTFQIAMQGGTDSRTRFPANRGSGQMARDRWYVYEVELIVNNPGRADGTIRVWTGGSLTHEYRDVTFTKPGENASWEQVQWSPTWGGGGANTPHEFRVWLDHSYISTGAGDRP